MYYLELIERFWIFNEKAKLGSTAIAMYLYLLKTAKVSDSYNFKASDVVLGRELGMAIQTVKTTKQKLSDLGLIRFQTKNGVSGSYRLILNYSLDSFIPEQIKKVRPEVPSPFQDLKDDLNPEFPNAEIKSNFGNNDQKTKATSDQPADQNIKIPEWEEFLTYAKTLSAYHSELCELLEGKYKSWKDNGWKNAAGRSITNWKSTVKSALPFLQNTEYDDQLSIQTIPGIKRPKTNFGK